MDAGFNSTKLSPIRQDPVAILVSFSLRQPSRDGDINLLFLLLPV
uniref:Uncharacterized protein n=1 Tax=Anguilla anguilla TaxID=7936 RepID=A0A0E9S2U8_ANGAN